MQMQMQMQRTPYTIPLLLILFILPAASPVSARGQLVGGRTTVSNVRANKDVQDLGRFAIEEYNESVKRSGVGSSTGLSHRHQHGHLPWSDSVLEFVEVVEAEKQVVSGIKYYLTIDAVQGKNPKRFEAVVVVKPWMQSRQLLNFAPAAPNKYKF